MNENEKSWTEQQKPDAQSVDLKQNSKLLSKLDNFWFHYKWPVIIGGFFLIVLIIGVVQIFSRTATDAAVTFAGPAYISPIQCAEIESELASIMKDDNTGDGKKVVKFTSYTIYYETDLEGIDSSEIDLSQNATNKSNYDDYVSAGECSIYFVSKTLYDNFVRRERLRALSDVTDIELPTEDGYGVRLGDLPIYQLDAFKVMPEDTYVCLTKPYMYGESSKEKAYAATVEYFKTIIEFGS